MRDTAEEFLTALFEFDGSTINEDFDRILQLRHRRVPAPGGQLLLGRRAAPGSWRRTRWPAGGNLKDLYVQSVDGDTAHVFAVGDETIANNLATPAGAGTSGDSRSGVTHEDGEWKVFS